ncbi:ParB/RepB/Spo0J family partition protein [Kitasatospora griseola]|uniref:ParB/RepB/Spo0J family partition protein n=1 Tax=Kitasatospora griseola TaxID=2064 RepID=UPI003423EA6E
MTTIAPASSTETRTPEGLRYRSIGKHAYLDPRLLVLDEHNVRTEGAEPDQAMLASVEADGVEQSLIVRPRPDGTYGVLAGQIRMLSAQTAAQKCIDEGREDDILAVPCWVREDLVGQSPQQIAIAVAKSLQENQLRKAMTTGDLARAAEQLDLLGLSDRELRAAATTSGLTVEQIKQAHRATALPTEVKQEAAQHEFDLDELISLAEVESVPGALEALAEARAKDIESGSKDQGNWKHAMQRLLQKKEESAVMEAARAEWTAKGLVEVRHRSWYEPGAADRMLSDLLDADGKPIDPEQHSTECPGKAFAFKWGRAEDVVFACTDFRANGHKRADLARASKPEGPSPAEVGKKNKEEEAAREVRGQFVKKLVQGRLSDAAKALAMQVVTEMPSWYADAVSPSNAELVAALFDEPCKPVGWQTPRGFLNAMNARLRRNRRDFNAVFAQVAMAFERKMSRKKHWADADGWTADWLRFLKSEGYTLSGIEKEMVAAVEKKEKAEAKKAQAKKAEAKPTPAAPKAQGPQESEQRENAGTAEEGSVAEQPDVQEGAASGTSTDTVEGPDGPEATGEDRASEEE